MIRWLSLRNFRCWRGLEHLNLRPITILFGTNSSGKTALLHSLLMLKQTSESNDRGLSLVYDGYAELGSFRDVVHGHDESVTLGVDLHWASGTPFAPRDTMKPVADAWVRYEASWRDDDGVKLEGLRYRTNAGFVSVAMSRGDDGYASVAEAGAQEATRRPGRPWPLPGPESCYALPKQVARDWPGLDLLEFNHQFELLMNRIHYLGPLRNYPRREYLWTGEAPTTLARDGAGTVEALLADARNGRGDGIDSAKPSLVQAASSWLNRFGLAGSFEVVPIGERGRYYEVRLVTPDGKAKTLLPDVGFGVSQVLPVIVQLHFVPEGSIVLLEQPEIHLHPGAAANLADLLLDVAERRNLQLIIESHSEHLLTRLQRRIAEGEHPFATPEKVALYFCRLHEGAAEARTVELNEMGEIVNWPDGFFGDLTGEAMAMAEAVGRARPADQGDC